MEQPLISVIIPFYHGERFIAETLESLLSQQYSNLEIIIVNDGSSEHSLKALDKFKDKIILVHQANKGQAAARNTGMKMARGSIIGLLDQDDLWPQDHISLMLPYLVGENNYDFVRGCTEKFRITPSGTKETLPATFHEDLIGAALYRPIVFEKVGLFDEDMRQGEDFDWNIRLRESTCKEKRITQTTLQHRRHDANQSDTKDFIKNGQFASIKKKIARLKTQNKAQKNNSFSS